MIKRCTVFGAVQDKELGIRDLVGGNVSKNGKPIFYHSSLVNFAPQDKEGNVIGDPSINLDCCNGDNKDFGKGFYLSPSEEFCDWYIDKGAKCANSGIPANTERYYLYNCLVDESIEKCCKFLNLTDDLKALAKICYIGRFHCTDNDDKLRDYDAILGWMVNDLEFDSIRDMLVVKGLLTEEYVKSEKVYVYTPKEVESILDFELDYLLDVMFMTDEHGAYQLAIKSKDIVRNENLVKLLAPKEIVLGS